MSAVHYEKNTDTNLFLMHSADSGEDAVFDFINALDARPRSA